MVYNFKEYKPVFDTPMKREQELAISRKIMDLLNKNKFDSIEKFIEKKISYQDFLKQYNMDIVVKHFGNNLSETDFNLMINKIFELTKEKKSFDNENINTTNIDDKTYNSFKGKDKTYFIDDSISNKTIEEEMKDIQNTSQEFQTSDANQNTENIFKELEDRKKENLNIQFLNDINVQMLNDKQRNFFIAAAEYQKESNHIIRVDLNRGIVVDENDNIKKIEFENGIFFIRDEDQSKKNEKSNSYQKQLTMPISTNTIYNN